MRKEMKNIVYLAVATAAATKRFAESEVRRYVDAGHISSKEGKRIVDDVIKRTKKQKVSFEKAVHDELKGKLKKAIPLLRKGERAAERIAFDILAKRSLKKTVKKVKKIKKKVKKAAKTKVRKLAKKIRKR